MKEHLLIILNKLLINHNIYINENELKLQLLSHPSYPSLYAIADILDYNNIENLAVTIPVNEETIEALPIFFITKLKTHESPVLVEKKKGRFKIIGDDKSTVVFDHEKFVREWDGVLLAVEKDSKSLGRKFIARYIYSLGYLLIATLLGGFIFLNYSLFGLTHFLLSLTGLIISILILKTEVGIPSFAAKSICSFVDEKNCESVLNSTGATLYGAIKLSDLCLLAYGTYSLTWIFYFLTGVTQFMPIIGMSLLALPFSVYSIYYQYFVLKKWCPLCLGIVAVLLLQSATVLLAGSSAFLVSMNSLILLLLSFLITISAGSYLLSFYKRKIILEKKEIDYYRLKRNFPLFQLFYNKNKSIGTTGEIKGEIILGNKNADFSIVLITNPICPFCREVHKDMMRLLNKAPEKVKLIIRFYVNIKNEKSEAYQIASELLRIHETSDMETLLEALEVVYHKGTNVSNWLKENQSSPGRFSCDNILREQYDWCKDNQVEFTPNLILNGKQYPAEYEASDLFYFIDELVDASVIVS